MYNQINVSDLKENGQTDSNISRTYKDSIFRKLFNNKENALSLYNALTNQTLTDDIEIQFTTLEDVIYYTTTIQRLYNNKRFYDASKVILPRPEFIMLYNGTQEYRRGKKPEIMEKCEVLSQYSRLVSAVREVSRRGELSEFGLE